MLYIILLFLTRSVSFTIGHPLSSNTTASLGPQDSASDESQGFSWGVGLYVGLAVAGFALLVVTVGSLFKTGWGTDLVRLAKYICGRLQKIWRIRKDIHSRISERMDELADGFVVPAHHIAAPMGDTVLPPPSMLSSLPDIQIVPAEVENAGIELHPMHGKRVSAVLTDSDVEDDRGEGSSSGSHYRP